MTANSRPSVSTAMWRLLLPCIVAALVGHRGLDGLAVDDARRGAGLPPGALAVDHQRHVMDGAKQQGTHEAPEPTIDRLPRREMHREHPPLAARPHHVAQGIHHLTQVGRALAPASRRLRQQGSSAPIPRRSGRWDYRFVFFSMAAMRLRVALFHIDSLNHDRLRRSSLFQTAS